MNVSLLPFIFFAIASILPSDWERIHDSFSSFDKNISLKKEEVAPFSQGMMHCTYLVETGGSFYVIKLFDPECQKSVLLKKFMTYQSAFEKGIGPCIWHFDIIHYALIMDYIQPSTTRPLNNKEALLLLRAFHSPLENEPFSTIYKRIHELSTYEIDLLYDLEIAKMRLQKIESLVKQCCTLCHFDFHDKNFITTDTRTFLIDFDDADYGHPFYDIAKFALSGTLMDEEAILKEYLQRDPTEEEQELMFLMKQVSYLSSATRRLVWWVREGFSNGLLYQNGIEKLSHFLKNTENEKFPFPQKRTSE